MNLLFDKFDKSDESDESDESDKSDKSDESDYFTKTIFLTETFSPALRL